ncbi:type I polyketide synthase, partial [Streptomyces sp. NPDC048638]|uniref:type I polyketide synthase n=1 Tax=Streptomyces sp. NPDC048638 TaxID=3365580 RepID=UPI0037136A24
WARHVREAVRFADGIQKLYDNGTRTFLELGPNGVLSAMAHDCLAGPEHQVVAAAVLRPGGAESRTVATALAEALVRGAALDWDRVFPRASPVPLPTYPFQRSRHWLNAPTPTAGAGALGLDAVDHPLLTAALDLSDEERTVLTGQVSLGTHPWLADHSVAGTALIPASALLELALCAGERVGCPEVDELLLEEPLPLPDRTAVRLRVTVGPPEDSGRRTVVVHSSSREGEWTRHATGTLAPPPQSAPRAAEAWPPAGAVPVDLTGLYERLADRGYDYGPGFRRLQAAWQHDDVYYVEVAATAEPDRPAAYGLHPAALDAALHVLADATAGGAEESLRLPFSWSGVRLWSSGAAVLRVRLAVVGDEISLEIADDAGEPVASIGSLSLGRVPAERLRELTRAGTGGSLLVDWHPAESAATGSVSGFAVLADDPLALADNADTPVARCASLQDAPTSGFLVVSYVSADATADDPVAEAHAAVRRTAELCGRWLADNRLSDTRLVVVTRRAVATAPEEDVEDTAAAAVWGLLRSAQNEHPGRIVLLDTDDGSLPAVHAALATGHPQMALRDGRVRVPRLVRPDTSGWVRRRIDPDGTVLITGGTGALGALLARHLVREHGARHLLLAGRRGPAAPGAEALARDLSELGAQVEIAACDVADPEDLAALLSRIPEDQPLTAVVHAAGVVEDATVGSLRPEQIDRVLRAKVDAAWHLHRLTQGMSLDAFVLFSSFAAIAGNPGQGAYAAANSFLDALSRRRYAAGLPSVSLAWGVWAGEGMAGRLGDADLARLSRTGVRPTEISDALARFDDALGASRPHLAPVDLEPRVLRSLAEAGRLPDIFRQLAPAARPRTRGTSDLPRLPRRLAALGTGAEREALLLDHVRSTVGVVLGYATADGPEPQWRAFNELGFDSLTAVELRNRLAETTGLELPATLVFDHPTSAAVAGYLANRMAQVEHGPAAVVASAVPAAPGRPAQASAGQRDREQAHAVAADLIRESSVAGVLEFIDRELGRAAEVASQTASATEGSRSA